MDPTRITFCSALSSRVARVIQYRDRVTVVCGKDYFFAVFLKLPFCLKWCARLCCMSCWQTLVRSCWYTLSASGFEWDDDVGWLGTSAVKFQLFQQNIPVCINTDWPCNRLNYAHRFGIITHRKARRSRSIKQK